MTKPVTIKPYAISCFLSQKNSFYFNSYYNDLVFIASKDSDSATLLGSDSTALPTRVKDTTEPRILVVLISTQENLYWSHEFQIINQSIVTDKKQRHEQYVLFPVVSNLGTITKNAKNCNESASHLLTLRCRGRIAAFMG